MKNKIIPIKPKVDIADKNFSNLDSFDFDIVSPQLNIKDWITSSVINKMAMQERFELPTDGLEDHTETYHSPLLVILR